MFKIFVGFDPREEVAYEVCKYSIESRATIPVEVIKLDKSQLSAQGLYTRQKDPLSSTEFTFTRFFVPYLSEFSGISCFCDCDFLWLCDAAEVYNLAEERFAVQVVQHDYRPTETTKMDGQKQHLYPRKNWSSMILYNNSHHKNAVLTPQYLNTASGNVLHRFLWLKDHHIGSLPHTYNWLENWYKEPEDGKPSAIHYTRGGPWFKKYENVEYADLWKKEYKAMTGKDWSDDMILDK